MSNCEEADKTDNACNADNATEASDKATATVNMYYINLDARKDRAAQMEEDFKDMLSEDLKLIHWPATKHVNGWKGCILSHAAVLKHLTSTDKSGFYCVLEDDCKINSKDTFKDLLPKYITYLKDHSSEWDLFLAGGIYVKPTRIVCKDPYIIECSWIACSHFVIYNDKSAAEVIKYAESDKYDTGIDNFNARTNRNRIWVPYPLLCDQYTADTNIGNFTDYLEKIRLGFKNVHLDLDKFITPPTANKGA